MVVPSLSNDEAKKLFGSFEVKSLPSGKEYVRLTAQPK